MSGTAPPSPRASRGATDSTPCAGRLEILLDGGIRRGADVANALALGARACMVGRPYLYGLAVGGQAGVA